MMLTKNWKRSFARIYSPIVYIFLVFFFFYLTSHFFFTGIYRSIYHGAILFLKTGRIGKNGFGKIKPGESRSEVFRELQLLPPSSHESTPLENSHSQTLPRGAVCSRFRCRLKSRPARSCRRWVLSMTRARSGSRNRWSLPSAGPRVRGTPSPRGPDRAVNILPPGSARIASRREVASSCDRLTPDTLIRDGTPRPFRTAERLVTGGTWPTFLTAPVLGHLILMSETRI